MGQGVYRKDELTAAKELSGGEELSRLETLGISLLSEWDVAIFLYQHGSSIINAGQIALLTGYESKDVSDALNRLESLGLLKCSRASHGVRVYQFMVPTGPVRRECFDELRVLAENRAGRLLLIKSLRSPPPPPAARNGDGPS
jgi:DNA-binding MarR family transcriptional regulator